MKKLPCLPVVRLWVEIPAVCRMHQGEQSIRKPIGQHMQCLENEVPVIFYRKGKTTFAVGLLKFFRKAGTFASGKEILAVHHGFAHRDGENTG